MTSLSEIEVTDMVQFSSKRNKPNLLLIVLHAKVNPNN